MARYAECATAETPVTFAAAVEENAQWNFLFFFCFLGGDVETYFSAVAAAASQEALR